MTPLKARIFTVVRRAGRDGILSDDLFAIVYDGRLPRYQGGRAGRNESRSRDALKANIWQINRSINGQRIVGQRGNRPGFYRLIRGSDT